MGLLDILVDIFGSDSNSNSNMNAKSPYRNDGRMDQRTKEYQAARDRAAYARGCKDGKK